MRSAKRGMRSQRHDVCDLSACNKNREELSDFNEERGETGCGGDIRFQEEFQPVFRLCGFFSQMDIL